ncbi:MAG TPA: DUF1631 family protein [Gemmatimonadaceae bacterium]
MSGPAPAVDRGAMLVQCRAAALQRLCAQLEPLLDALTQQCYQLSQTTRDREERDDYAKGVFRLRDRRAAFLECFQKEYGERFEAAATALQSTASSRVDRGGDDLAMLKTNLLENQVAVGKLAAQIKQAANAELAQLSARVGTLCRRATVDDGENPLGPLTIASALYAGVSELDLAGRVLRALRPELEKRITVAVLELFKALNAALDRAGVAAAASRSTPARAAAPALTPAAAEAAAPGPSPAAVAAASEAVGSTLRDADVPPAFALFLLETWTEVLARSHAEQDAEGAAWREALTTMTELVRSLTPGLESAERSRLVGRLPALLKGLTAGMDAVALDVGRRKEVLDTLMAHHRELMRGPAKA